jgi:glucoamylase
MEASIGCICSQTRAWPAAAPTTLPGGMAPIPRSWQAGYDPYSGSPTTVVSALKVGSPNVFVANDNGYAAMASDCNVELHKNRTLISRFDNASDGNVVQCGEIGGIGADTTFTVALGHGGDAATALAAAEGSLAAGFPERETTYRKGWSDYVDGLRSAPSSV